MNHHFFYTLLFAFFTVSLTAQTTEKKPKKLTTYEGFFDFHWEESTGKIYLDIAELNKEFLYVHSLTGGVGSNDIGLDRNQLGDNRVVKFIRSGNKILLIQPNQDYRAVSDNAEERASVQEAFAQSILWGAKIEHIDNEVIRVDLTSFLMRDPHGVAKRLNNGKQGSYKLDTNRSAIHLERTKNFPKNSEFDVWLTFAGEAKGANIRSVTPTPDAVTVRQHHSFVDLPDDNYEPRVLDPRSGYFGISYQDYATPISQPLTKRFIMRHRLEKKDPTAAMSEAVEPIVYYLDRGTPEPIKSALIEGASWWNQAFEAAGYKDAFQVKVLPPEADPMDVRYNVINWVHRSTRGWSYGGAVTDPRTGEIIKGHVLLGSLRVRQDFLIAQGLIEAYKDGKTPDPRMEEMALARLRQLSAHEVGHTLGLAHNFAASYTNRASVMDYPHPYITVDNENNIDFSNAYDRGIGEWDKRTILYGYQDFPEGTDETAALEAIIMENIAKGYLYISDQDARPQSGAHPQAHLWDNGASAVKELQRVMRVRQVGLNNFSEKNIPEGAPMADLERVFVPLYLSHRYQVEAAAKLVGGVNYSYAMRGDGQVVNEPITTELQEQAIEVLLQTLTPEFLVVPENIVALIPPQPIGYQRDRELFKTQSLTFDPMAAAESSAAHTIQLLLHPERLKRMNTNAMYDKKQLTAASLLKKIRRKLEAPDVNYPALQATVERLFILQLLHLAANKKTHPSVAGIALQEIQRYGMRATPTANDVWIKEQIRRFREHPEQFVKTNLPKMPDGSPIGCGH